MILALHHDNAESLHRAHQVADRLQRIKTVPLPNKINLMAIPVSAEIGDAVHARLSGWAEDKRASKRMVGGIGLGSQSCGPIPAHYLLNSRTEPDGSLIEPIAPEAFGTLEDEGRIVGHTDGGKSAEVDLGNEPTFVAGMGIEGDMREQGMPDIMTVLAIGKTSSEAVTNGQSLCEIMGFNRNPKLVLKVARVTALDGHALRTKMQEAMENAEGSAQRAMKIGLGLKNDLTEDDEWSDVDAETRKAIAADGPAQVTIDEDGVLQVWDAGATTDPHWRTRRASQATPPDGGDRTVAEPRLKEPAGNAIDRQSTGS